MISRIRKNIQWSSSFLSSMGRKPSPREQLSEKAENRVAQEIRRLGGEDWDVYLRVRVPILDTPRGKGEIDVVAVGSRAVLAVEVKNWVGLVDVKDGEFFQKGKSRGRVLDAHSRKVESLERMYRSETNRNVPPIYSLVVFPNRRTKFTEEASRMWSCCDLDGVADIYRQTILGQSEMHPNTRKEFSGMFKQFGTWDTIEYHGGLTQDGDVEDGFSICSDEGLAIDRLSVSRVSFRPSRKGIARLLLGPGVIAKVEFKDGTTRDCMVDPFQRFKFFPAGKFKAEHDTSSIRVISFGHSGVEEWRKARNRNNENRGPRRKREPRSSTYSPGDVVVGTVERWVDSGVLVELDRTGSIGLLHNRSFSTMAQMDISRVFYSKGKEIEVTISKTFDDGNILLDFADEGLI